MKRVNGRYLTLALLVALIAAGLVRVMTGTDSTTRIKELIETQKAAQESGNHE